MLSLALGLLLGLHPRMPSSWRPYPSIVPRRAELEQTRGVVLLEFGADWCGFSKAAQPSISDALCRHPEVQHIRVADSPSCRLGRSYRVKLWPTLILLRDGREVERVIRPDRRAVKKLLAAHATRKRDAQQVAAHNVMQKDLETIP